MTIRISRNYVWEIYFEDEPTKYCYDSADEYDVLWQYPSQFGQGYSRQIELPDGSGLMISDYQLHDRLEIKVPERPGDCIQFDFCLSGGYAGQHWITSTGVHPPELSAEFSELRHLFVYGWISSERFASFAGNADKEIDPALKQLIQQPDQQNYVRLGNTSPMMQAIMQQILHCPYWGMTKRMYLESKLLELMALLLDQEKEVQQGELINTSLNPDDIDRLHHARNLLLQQIKQPPSLKELARQAGLNEYTLKRGFRQVFGRTVFGYLHDHRMEQARQLLETGIYKVEDVAQTVGYRNLSAFSRAFHKHFGVLARDCKKR
ncbi:MAG: helix-turn-helix transcriptional regulator [Leptolyngbya sp. SIO4C1]|nr:helix-turn-helix transcriptional regulator [Leptolyngbya sp. SIO4C1]